MRWLRQLSQFLLPRKIGWISALFVVLHIEPTIQCEEGIDYDKTSEILLSIYLYCHGRYHIYHFFSLSKAPSILSLIQPIWGGCHLIWIILELWIVSILEFMKWNSKDWFISLWRFGVRVVLSRLLFLLIQIPRKGRVDASWYM